MKISELIEQRDAKVEDLAALATTEERAETHAADFDALEAEIREMDAEIGRLQTLDEVRRTRPTLVTDGTANEAPVFQTDANPYEGDLRTATGSELRGRALKAAAEQPYVTDEIRESLTRHIERNDDRHSTIAQRVLVTSSPDYRDAFSKVATGRDHLLRDHERAALERAMSLTDGAGGYAVPAPIDPTLISSGTGSANPFRQIANVKTITNDVWRGLSSTAVTASWDAEAAEVSDDTTTFTQPSVTAYKAAAFVPASIEIAGDYPNLANDLVMLIQEAKDDLEAAAFATGSGSAQPFGIATAIAAITASRVAATTNNAFGLVDVYALFEGLPPKHRSRASWAANLAILNDIRQFGTANNYSGFTVDLTASGIPAVLGRPIYEASSMDGALATGNDDILVVGDFQHYVIADRVGLSIEFIPHLFDTATNRPSGSRGWYAYWRVGADSVQDDAFRILRV